ncbi:MAG TPA: PAS domain S-box protein [Coleofasciculaceae cyanobacterium]|jgi:PAS domain S-box-containing protein
MGISPNHLPIDSTNEPRTIESDLLTTQAAMINQITQAISGALVFDQVLNAIAQQLVDALQISGCLIFQAEEEQGAASWMSIVTPQQDGKNALPERVYSVCREFYQYYHSKPAQGNPAMLLWSRPNAPGEQHLPQLLQDSAQDCGISTLLIVPILHRQSSIGAITLYECEQEREWRAKEIIFVQAIAAQCAIALTQKDLEQRYQTELKKRQECESTLQESQRRLQAICNQSRQFIGLLTPEGIILEVNQTALDFAGLKAQDILGCQFWEARWWLSSIETIRQLQEAIATAAAGRCIRYEVNVLGKRDRVATLDFSLKPQRDETGQVILLVFEGQDITDYKLAQSALATSEARNRALLEAIPDLIFRVNRDGIFLDYKAAKDYALPASASEIIGRHLHQVLPTQVAGQAWHHVEIALETNKVQIIEFQLCLNGKSHDFEARLVKSGLDEVAVIVQDITERVRAQVLLQQVNNALELIVEERTTALREANHALRTEIIERKRIEQALRESEERFRRAVVNAPFPIMIHAEGGDILKINQVWTKWTGYTHDEIPTIADWLERAYGERQHLMRSLIERSYTLNDRTNDGEFTVTTKDGTNRIWNFSSAPLGQLPDGRRVIISMATDITQRKQAEIEARFLQSVTQALFESQDFHAALAVAIQKVCEATGWDFGEAWVPRSDGSALECSPVWFSKAKGLEKFRNASKLLTFPPGIGLPGRVWVSQQPEWRRDVSSESNEIYHRSQLAKEAGLKAGLGIPLLTRKGILAVLVFYMFESQDEDERLIELISASTELGLMIQRKQAEGEIRQALSREKELTELKSRFISMTSHEFRTPLTTILSSAELLEDYSHKWTNEKKITHLHRIQTAVKHMTKLLNDVLVLGKADAGKLEFNPAPLDLENFCHNLVEELQLNDANQHIVSFRVESRESKHGDVSKKLSASSAPTSHSLAQRSEAHSPLSAQLCMDEKLLRQILENLLSNAIKYSPSGSTVEFTLSRFFSQAVFQIRDQGIGIPTEDQKRLFDTFHRASNVGIISGTGLGLAIVKRCVDIHQGQIAMESEVGVGTTFTVTLPTYNSVDRS